MGLTWYDSVDLASPKVTQTIDKNIIWIKINIKMISYKYWDDNKLD